MSLPVTIRPAAPEDAEALLFAIYAPYVKHTAITFEYKVPYLQGELRKRITHTLQHYPYLVAERTTSSSTQDIKNKADCSACTEIAGYAYAGPLHARAAYAWSVETSIYVRESERKSGIGKALYASLEKALAAQNMTDLNACIASPVVDDEISEP